MTIHPILHESLVLMDADLLKKIDDAANAGKLTADAPQNLREWLSKDCLAEFHGPITTLIVGENWERLNELFWTSIPFGTGGRRGPMGEMGPATINDRTIAESAHGMAVYLHSTGVTGGSAVVAHDTRNQSSHFARITACTLAAHGLHVYLFETHRSTPALSFAVRHLQCDIGIMISASHNPPEDNGFKAYWRNGGQVIPPHDKGIIAEVENAETIPTIEFDAGVVAGRITFIGGEVDKNYVDRVVKLSESDHRGISAVFTPLHGVGETNVFAVLQQAGFDQVELFELQRKADGDFPTVPGHLPNPENLAVFDAAIDWVQQSGHPADLILASDPDSDRLGVMVRNRAGQFTSLSGNQVGALITDYLLRKRKQSGRFSPRDYVVQTLVTTPLTKDIAKHHGARAFSELLVGFKYIAQTMEEQGTEHFVFGTEESIGFLAGDYCRDKDAAVCALYILELAAELKQQGRTLLDQLNTLYETCGYHCEGQKSIYCEGPSGKAKIDRLMETLRTDPPTQFGPVRLVELADYETGTRRAIPSGRSLAAIEQPRGDLLIFQSDPESPVRIQIATRPSGTEPKIKFYFFCQSDLSPGTNLDQARGAGDSVMQEVQQALSTWAQEKLAAE